MSTAASRPLPAALSEKIEDFWRASHLEGFEDATPTSTAREAAEDRRRAARASLDAALRGMLDDAERLRGKLERERTWACTWIERMRAAIRSHCGNAESRGCYEWDDDEYRKEFARALDTISGALDRAERDTHARDWTDCPTTQAEVDAARAARPEANDA
jgi:hypothetical protein